MFLDEPTGGVDPLSRRQFWDLINDLSGRGVTVFVTTHYLDEAEHCHRIAIIHAGKLAALGSASQLKERFAERPIIELTGDRPVELMEALEQLPGVEKTSLFGTSVHAVVNSPARSIRRRCQQTPHPPADRAVRSASAASAPRSKTCFSMWWKRGRG